MIDKLLLPFDLLSDPEGEVAIKPFGFWDESGRISKPALVLTDRDGIVRYIYEGRDFADRPKDAEIMEAVRLG
jgi:peroxiredoxin